MLQDEFVVKLRKHTTQQHTSHLNQKFSPSTAMAPARHDQDSSRSRQPHHSRHDRDDASIDSRDSGYGGSAANSPKDAHNVQRDALRDYHAESAKHHAESGRRFSQSEDAEQAGSKVEREERDSDGDSDYDPRDKYYLKVDDDEYKNMTSGTTGSIKDDQVRDRADEKGERRRSDASGSHRRERRQSSASERNRRERRERRESDASNASRRSDRDRNRREDRDRDRHKSLTSRRHSTTSDGGDSSERRVKHSSRRSNASSSPPGSRDRKESSRRRTDASTASHSRHDANYRSLSPIPSDSWEESEDSRERSPRRRASRSHTRSERDSKTSPKRSKSRDESNRDESARYIDPDGEAAKSFLDKLTKGVDLKSVGKVGLDAAAVAAIKIAVGTQIPWKQRIPKTITVGAAAAIMDFIVKKTNFKPKGMIGTIYARQFVEIVLANLIINPVSTKVTGAAQNTKGKAPAGKAGGGGGGKR